MVGFTGSRHLGVQFLPLVRQVIGHFAGQSLGVGDCRGADELVRQVAPSAQVFRAQGSAAWQLAARSSALVKASSTVVGFVMSSCPSGIVPSSSFHGAGSGTWGTLALAAGTGRTVFVVPCGQAVPPAAWGGSWAPVQLGSWVCAWQWVPATQLGFGL